MDLSAWLLRHTPPRPLVVTAPGGTAARLAVERAVRERGWQPALSSAEANILVVAGESQHALEPYVRQVWSSMPAPRARADVYGPQDTAKQLDSALLVLRDLDRQREHAMQPMDVSDRHDHAEHQPDHDIADAEHHDIASVERHENHENDGDHMGHGGHGDHGHHMGGMAMPGGVPMADRADDRDGLKLDELHLPLGPLLPLWPPGLIVHTRLQGDVVQEAAVEVVGGHGSSWPGEDTARRLDSSARLLALAGWVDVAVVAQCLRDEALAGTEIRPRLVRWTRRVRRSRTLRWLLNGVGAVSDGPAQLTGDALDRLYRWLDPTPEPPTPHATRWTLDNLPALLAGTELATARLLVASLDPDLDLLAHHEAHHG